MVHVESLSAGQAAAHLPELIELLQDAVNSGASLGFLPPLTEATALAYWHGVIPDLAQQTRLLLVARQDGRIVGMVQLELATRPNALHRAEVQKLCVVTHCRNQGIGQSLMAAVEAQARDLGRTLLVLDTRQGDAAEGLYIKLGYTRAGAIPAYARSADGSLHTTVIFYRLL